MDFADKLAALANKSRKIGASLATEEATKNALIMPFIQYLGYDVFNPEEVIPEFTADIGNKKGEKVDYAICEEGKPIMLIECKSYGATLDSCECTQLQRYFNVTEAPIGILTDGNRYKFYSEFEEKNRMDAKPFMEFSIEDMDERLIGELRKYAKGKFNVTTLSSAEELKYTREFKKVLAEMMESPDEDFVRVMVRKVYSGMFTQNAKERFTPIVKTALTQFVNDLIAVRLKSAMGEGNTTDKPGSGESEQSPATSVKEQSKIDTTEDEWQAYYLVKSLLVGVVDSQRVTIRDSVNFCTILLDDTQRKPLLRLHFNNENKSVGFYDNGKKDDKVVITTLDDIIPLADRIKTTVAEYEAGK